MGAEEPEAVTIAKLLESGAITGHKDGNYGSKYPRIEEFGPVGVPFLTAKSLSDGKIDIAGAPRLAEDRADDLRFGFVEPGDVLLSHNATVGRVAVVPEFAGRILIGTSLTYFRVNPAKISPRYLAAYFSGKAFQDELAAVMSHSTRNQVPITAQRHLRVVLPALPLQRAIAHILGTLDDKIELNRLQNETLEAVARALFKSWFVDYDPIRAKMEGRETGLPKHLTDLFPMDFEDSQRGAIPRGWGVQTIAGLADVLGGSTPSTKEPRFWEGGTHYWATPKDLSGLASPILLKSERCITDAGLSQISSGLLPKGTILLSSRAPIGYLAIAEVPVAINQGFIAMTPKPGVSNIFLLIWASLFHDEIVSRANGSTFLEISKSSFRPIPVVAPPANLMAEFDKHVQPIFNQIAANERENQTLVTTRDLLLPRLLSGELAVNAAGSITGGGS